eukprot:4053648-Pyramimonas_sp.AAC.1
MEVAQRAFCPLDWRRQAIPIIVAARADDVAAHAVADLIDCPTHWLAHCAAVKRRPGATRIARG